MVHNYCYFLCFIFCILGLIAIVTGKLSLNINIVPLFPFFFTSCHCFPFVVNYSFGYIWAHIDLINPGTAEERDSLLEACLLLSTSIVFMILFVARSRALTTKIIRYNTCVYKRNILAIIKRHRMSQQTDLATHTHTPHTATQHLKNLVHSIHRSNNATAKRGYPSSFFL